jgi:hypothetical protein
MATQNPVLHNSRNENLQGECHGQADHIKKEHHTLIVTENTKYALRVANPRAADRPAGVWPPEERIIMTP